MKAKLRIFFLWLIPVCFFLSGCEKGGMMDSEPPIFIRFKFVDQSGHNLIQEINVYNVLRFHNQSAFTMQPVADMKEPYLFHGEIVEYDEENLYEDVVFVDRCHGKASNMIIQMVSSYVFGDRSVHTLVAEWDGSNIVAASLDGTPCKIGICNKYIDYIEIVGNK